MGRIEFIQDIGGSQGRTSWHERQDTISSRNDESIEGLKVLLVEDEFLLACSLEEDLRAAGIQVVGMYSGLSAAREGASRGGFDLAILDINLRGEMVYPLADELLARGAPFLFLTGYVAMQLPERFRTQPRVAKPYDPAFLLREIRKMLPVIRANRPE